MKMNVLLMGGVLMALACHKAEDLVSDDTDTDTDTDTDSDTDTDTDTDTDSDTDTDTDTDGRDCVVEQIEPKRMYHIGHSLTDRMADLLNYMVESHTGEEVSYYYKSLPGSTLHNHWTRPADGRHGNMSGNPMDVLESGQFEVLSLTESTGIHNLLNHASRGSKEHANLWSDVFLEGNTHADPEIYIYSTWWARNEDGPDTSTTIQTFLEETTSRQPLWEELAEAVQGEHPSTPVKIIPGGLVLTDLQEQVLSGTLELPEGKTYRETFFKQNRPSRGGCDTRDYIHLSMEGIYAIALTHYATIYESCPIGLPTSIPYRGYDDGCIEANDVQIEPALALEIQRTVWRVVNDYEWSGL